MDPSGAPGGPDGGTPTPGARRGWWAGDIADGEEADAIHWRRDDLTERPAREIHQIVEAIVEQLKTLPRSQVKLRLEIAAEISLGLDRAKARTLIENANTLGFIEKSIE